MKLVFRSLVVLGVLGVVGVVGALAACGDNASSSITASPSATLPSEDAGGVATIAPAETGAPVPTPGCGLASVPSGLSEKLISVGGITRRYQLLVPAGYDATRPLRLVFVFHGLRGNGDQIRSYFGFEAQAAGQAVFIYPDGVTQPEFGATAWAISDLAFFDAMLTETMRTHCIDKSRVFAAGHSFGGYMSNLVGCARGDVVRAIAPVSGGFAVTSDCKGPVATWIAHGNNDTVVAESEGLAARDRWLGLNACSTSTKATTPAPCVTYDGCGSHPVTWCSFSGGHFPLPPFIRQGIWDFFKAL